MKTFILIICTLILIPSLVSAQDYESMYDDFMKAYNKNAPKFEKALEGIELDPEWTQMTGNYYKKRFAGFIPVKVFKIGPRKILGMMGVKGIHKVTDGFYIVSIDKGQKNINLVNSENQVVFSKPLILSDEDREKLRIYSEEGKPVGSTVGPDDMVDKDKIKKKKKRKALNIPGREFGSLCIGYKSGKDCIGLYLSW